MHRARVSRITAIAGTAALVLGLLPGLASAAIPTAVPAQAALVAAYSVGNDTGFTGSLTNTDTSTLSRLHLQVQTTGATALSYVRASINNAVVASACEGVGSPLPVDCLFRNVRPGDEVRVVIGVTPDPGAAEVRARYIWSTTGLGSGGGDNSHGDTWQTTSDSVSVLSSSPDYAGGFNESSIQTALAVSSSNPQAARLSNLPSAVPAWVRDSIEDVTAPDPGEDLFDCDELLVNCDQLVGDWVEVNVGDGQTFDSVFVIEIVYYQGNPRFFIHRYVDGDGNIVQETVEPCPRRNPASGAPCFTWKASTSTATIYTYFNGGWRG
ncbi:MAG TPA: hypothetical protein VFK54_05205 [Candidatus Limnocylindrales bacterium]|nr:hypothetical protein [Candidatus Limnocylindrales bacterium]